MPKFSFDYLRRVAYSIYKAAGVPEEEARIVANHQVRADLVGHPSHGVILLPVYMERIEKGHIVPGANFEVVKETPTTARINGNWGFGFVVTEKAMRMAIEKAKTQNVAAVTVFYQSHIGRIGEYAQMAAKEGMIGLITADSGAGGKRVVPFGGKEKRLGTNPISIAFPSNLEAPFFMDMATSTVASGKINVARARKEKVPPGWIIDKEGDPTVDPNDYYDGGALLPVGADRGHKGYCLSSVVEIFSGVLTGMGFGIDGKDWEARHGLEHRHNDGCFIAVFKVEAFRPLEEFKSEVTDFAKFLKSSTPAKGFEEVLYTGETEWLNEQRQLKEGIFIDEETWGKITGLAKEYELDEIIEQTGK
jgi:uncharacterized oxidoreductase